MSKVRREKHKTLVFNNKLGKELHKILFYGKKPRRRQLVKSHLDYLLRGFKNE